jgi:hypothetical protein
MSENRPLSASAWVVSTADRTDIHVVDVVHLDRKPMASGFGAAAACFGECEGSDLAPVPLCAVGPAVAAVGHRDDAVAWAPAVHGQAAGVLPWSAPRPFPGEPSTGQRNPNRCSIPALTREAA